MDPELAAVLCPIMDEMPWLTEQQKRKIVYEATSLVGQRTDIGLGKILAMGLRFAIENKYAG